MMNGETLDLCKENIQPLKQGRRASKLGLALLAQTDADVQEQLLKEREQHELEIMTYEGPDPLGPRCEYVHWIEQSCPKHGREVNLIPLLEDTIMCFKEDDRYKQDNRFIELIVKYIETQDNPVELFQMVYAQGLGTKCASFYKAWADQLDMNNDLQRADQVFQMALTNEAEPKDDVEQAHSRFQMSVGRRMMTGQLAVNDKSVSTETADRQRQVLGKIKKGGTHRPSSGLPGKLPLLPANRSLGGNSASSFDVFQEDENGLSVVKPSKAKLNVNSESSSKENIVKPGPWNQGFKRRPPVVPPTYVPSTPTFKVLMDEEEEETPQRPTVATPVPSNVLKSRKAALKHHAQELFKSPHPSNKPHLPVFEAFAGGWEFSFEELRWAYLCKKTGQGKSSGCEETPIKGVRSFTPGQCDTPVTPRCYLDTDVHMETYKTPAGRLIPILEAPDVETPAGPSKPTGAETIQNTPPTCVGSGQPTVSLIPSNETSYKTPFVHKPHEDRITSKTPFTLKLHEDGICAIPDTPMVDRSSATVDRFTTPSTPKARTLDTPSLGSIINRPKLSKPVKSTPFTIFTDED